MSIVISECELNIEFEESLDLEQRNKKLVINMERGELISRKNSQLLNESMGGQKDKPKVLFSDLLKKNNMNMQNLLVGNLPTRSKHVDYTSIKISEDMRHRCMETWQNSLIRRLDLSKIKIEELPRQLKKLWSCKESFEIIPLGRGFFVIRFSNAEDKNHVWCNGLWQVNSQLLRVKE